MSGTEAPNAHAARPAVPSRRFLRLARSRWADRLGSARPGRAPIGSCSAIEPTADYIAPGSIEEPRGRHGSEPDAPLQARLRAAVGMLFLMLGLAYGRHLLLPDSHLLLRVFHTGVLYALGAILFFLSRRPAVSRRGLRAIELAAFGLAILFFATAQDRLTLLRLQQDNPALARSVIKGAVLATCGVMAIYGLFLPNGWRRAALVVAPMALTPPAVALALLVRHPELEVVAARGASAEQSSEDLMMLLLGATATVVGAHRSGRVRVVSAEARSFGSYRLRQRIGAGGMGEVYLAEHPSLGRRCALKVIRPSRAADPRVLARFEREVRATARLSHGNTIEIYDCGRTEDGTLYYVMEYLPGLNLAELVERHGPMPPGRAIHLLRQACSALVEAHGEGLVHRDIKPANLFAAYRGGRYDVTKLLDFGLVKPEPGCREGSSQVSHDGVITGSPLYMAPEQALGDPVDRRGDLYSLGAVAYYLLTGRPPFPGNNPVRVMLAHAHDVVPPPSWHRPDLPDDLGRVILRCLAKKPDDRFPDAEALERALASCADAGRWTPEDAAQWWSAVRPRMA